MKAFLKRTRPGKRRSAAFTLVEVVLSLGIVSFGIVSMMGLLSVGITTFHSAINTTTEAQIVQQVANQLSLADYKAIKTNAEQTFYFSEEGIDLGPNASSTAIYSASISAPAQLTVPGGTNVDDPNTLTFVISVWNTKKPQNVSTFPIQIANDGS